MTEPASERVLATVIHSAANRESPCCYTRETGAPFRAQPERIIQCSMC